MTTLQLTIFLLIVLTFSGGVYAGASIAADKSPAYAKQTSLVIIILTLVFSLGVFVGRHVLLP